MENEEKQVTMDQFMDYKMDKKYKSCLKFHQSMGFLENWPIYEDFFVGNQWPEVTEATKNLPRLTFNIIKYIETHKKASVMNENIKMVFSSPDVDTTDYEFALDDVQNAKLGADSFTKFAEKTWERIKQDSLNAKLLSRASNVGTGVLHYFWDDSQSGGIIAKYIGDIGGEFLDPANVFFGDPQNDNVQQQPFILITSREFASKIKELAKQNGVPDMLIAQLKGNNDNSTEIYTSAKQEIDIEPKVTVFTEYFWQNGTVWFKKVCNDVIVVQPTDTKLKRYPIAVMPWIEREKCIYGIGDTEGLIPNQKMINFSLSMAVLSTQQTAWPKLIAKPGALKQKVTNNPGEILTDHWIGAGDGIKYLNAGQFNPMVLTLVDKFIEITKNFSGANDAAVGEAPGADMAAQAIMLLQRSAGVPIEDIKKRFYSCMEDVGRIWEEFFKVKYTENRGAKFQNPEGNEQMVFMTGSEYQDVPMELRIDIGPASTYSEYMAQTTLDKLYDKQAIDTITYLKYSPVSAVPFKDKLIKELEAKQQQALNQMMMGQMPSDIPGGDLSNPMPNGNPNEVIAPGNNDLGIPGVKEPNIAGINNGKM